MIVEGEYKFNSGNGCLLCPNCRTMAWHVHPTPGVKYKCPTCPDTWVAWRAAEESNP